ncbi:hypothetical protein KGQ20_08950 [Catenulispora sp. NF23]|uniref:Nitroreductase domain-containing protein n=1 Tax=Catenulispora pinistramenti TaxID=2705254 RepID=A0ABS5KMB9_9ACTN|nr:hypothetical protein [Catenulispora pinistramenti]MBS2547204.1 hypothetical protein [Catenulispora pinistramenti]
MEDNQIESATGALHRLTRLAPDWEWNKRADDPRIRHDIESNDEKRRTPPVKSYQDTLPRTALPRDLPAGSKPALAVLGGTTSAGAESASDGQGGTAPTGTESASAGTAPLDLAALSRVLFLAAGVVRSRQEDFGTVLFRASGSAGNRFPLELYVAIPELPGSDLPSGVHWYDPVDHALVRIGPPPADSGTGSGSDTDTDTGAPTIIVTGVPWRTGWRYAERGFRHIYWDCGTMLSQLLALADSGGLAPRLFTRFPDAAVSELVGVDGVHEWPIALVTLGAGAPSITAAEPPVAGVTDPEPAEFPLVTAAQHAGDLDRLGEPWDFDTPTVPTQDSPTLDAVIVKRGSQRRMDPSRGLPLETLRTCMSVALRGIDVPHWIAVHDVTGLPSGLYRWPELGNPVRSEHQDAMRAELHRVCLGQALGRDAAFVVIAGTDVAGLSDREYREAQLAAGIVEGRLHLAAYALDASATGMTFLDTEIPALLGDPETPDALLFTCVGVPGNTSKPAGRPGAPTAVRKVTPRE